MLVSTCSEGVLWLLVQKGDACVFLTSADDLSR